MTSSTLYPSPSRPVQPGKAARRHAHSARNTSPWSTGLHSSLPQQRHNPHRCLLLSATSGRTAHLSTVFSDDAPSGNGHRTPLLGISLLSAPPGLRANRVRPPPSRPNSFPFRQLTPIRQQRLTLLPIKCVRQSSSIFIASAAATQHSTRPCVCNDLANVTEQHNPQR